MKSNTPVSPQEGRQVVNVMEHVSEKALIEIVGDLSLEDKEFCEKETKQILELLSPKQFAALLLEAVTVIDLFENVNLNAFESKLLKIVSSFSLSAHKIAPCESSFIEK